MREVTIGGRLKGRVIRGGENVYPRKMEEFHGRHPKVPDAPPPQPGSARLV